MDQRGAWERLSCRLVIVIYAIEISGMSCLLKETLLYDVCCVDYEY